LSSSFTQLFATHLVTPQPGKVVSHVGLGSVIRSADRHDLPSTTNWGVGERAIPTGNLLRTLSDQTVPPRGLNQQSPLVCRAQHSLSFDPTDHAANWIKRQTDHWPAGDLMSIWLRSS
jgi:hypothetical protein